jgi:hypothetical protein
VWCAAVDMSQQLVDAPYRPITATATTPAHDTHSTTHHQAVCICRQRQWKPQLRSRKVL